MKFFSISLQALKVGNNNMKNQQTVVNLPHSSETLNTNFHFLLIWIFTNAIPTNKGLN